MSRSFAIWSCIGKVEDVKNGCYAGCPTLLALLALLALSLEGSLEGSCEGSSLRVGPSVLAHALRLGFVAQPLLAVHEPL